MALVRKTLKDLQALQKACCTILTYVDSHWHAGRIAVALLRRSRGFLLTLTITRQEQRVVSASGEGDTIGEAVVDLAEKVQSQVQPAVDVDAFRAQVKQRLLAAGYPHEAGRVTNPAVWADWAATYGDHSALLVAQWVAWLEATDRGEG